MNLPLVRLADELKSNTTPAVGDATLVIRRTSYPAGGDVSVADLYTDRGAYYFAPTESGLPAAISAGEDQGGGVFGREVAAALTAAKGNVTAARTEMAYAPLGHVPSPSQMPDPVSEAQAQAKKLGTPVPSPARAGAVLPPTRIDNYIWENSMDALSAAGGNLQVRIGVLQILATLPEVTVTKSVAAGQPALTLTAKQPALPSNYQEALTVNAGTGIPIAFAGGAPGQSPSVTIGYTVSRVTLSDVAAGKFSASGAAAAVAQATAASTRLKVMLPIPVRARTLIFVAPGAGRCSTGADEMTSPIPCLRVNLGRNPRGDADFDRAVTRRDVDVGAGLTQANGAVPVTHPYGPAGLFHDDVAAAELKVERAADITEGRASGATLQAYGPADRSHSDLGVTIAQPQVPVYGVERDTRGRCRDVGGAAAASDHDFVVGRGNGHPGARRHLDTRVYRARHPAADHRQPDLPRTSDDEFAAA